METDLRKADLRGANLRGANLSGAKMNRANLNDADLTTRQRSFDEVLEKWKIDGLSENILESNPKNE
jgi:uncharacterized protein YjbI with pentapeptide repeats